MTTKAGDPGGSGSAPSPQAGTGCFDVSRRGLVLRVVVQPGSAGDGVVGLHGDALKVRVQAPPVSGRANEAVLSVLAAVLGVPRQCLEVSAGASSRRKRVTVQGLSADQLEERVQRVVSRPG